MIDKNLQIYDSLCTGCSACTESCFFPDSEGNLPIKLIKNEEGLFVPRIDANICTVCNLCYKSCPVEDKLETNYSQDFSEVLGSYFAFSKDNRHRFEAATAGMTTEIATFLLRENIVECVISCKQNNDKSIETVYSFTEEEVKKTKGSIYRQVTLLEDIVKNLKEKNISKILLIGLPCHVEGMHLLQKKNKYLRKCLVYTCALYCKQTKTEEFSDVIHTITKTSKDNMIQFRGKGWPGIISVDDKMINFNNNFTNLLWATNAFTPEYCFSCSEPLGTNADISIGDAWLKSYLKDTQGSSFVTANTEFGKKILKQMSELGSIHLQSIPFDDILASQNRQAVLYKRKNASYRAGIFSANYNCVTTSVSLRYKMRTHWIKSLKSVVEFLFRKKIIYKIPIMRKVIIRINTLMLSLLKVD